ncbi:DUF6525 family protein [Roseivivax halodurans]|uniref:DUF6525 family protein n=1 Tax=Roseivivax halodurans TaxID=93683 RepID=UPI000A074550|nr:DUF6525 family protein [Roseivivax halodurans]
MSRNLSTSLRRRRRRGDPMRDFDRLPSPLRAWLAQAALPWSPASCRRIWRKARAAGSLPQDIITILDRAERVALERDTSVPKAPKNSYQITAVEPASDR